MKDELHLDKLPENFACAQIDCEVCQADTVRHRQTINGRVMLVCSSCFKTAKELTLRK